MAWKVESEPRMEPPIHTEYFRSGGAVTLTFMLGGHRDCSSFTIRSAKPAMLNVHIKTLNLCSDSSSASTNTVCLIYLLIHDVKHEYIFKALKI